MNGHRLDVVNLGLAFAVVWGLGILALGLAAWLAGWGTPLLEVIASLYIGYAPSLPGSLIGTAWAVVDGFIWGALIAWVYNLLQGRRRTGA